MATVYRIHPAIGIARVGNSPAEFFIGPERIGEIPNPPGGFKDAQCRVKRQAARFRIFAHHDDNTVAEITDAEAEIAWTVHLVNSKAAHPGRGNTESATDLTIDPGPRTLTGPNQSKAFDNGQIKLSNASPFTVALGEVRSDDANHLLVLGGFGKSGSPAGTGLDGYFWASDDWYDDVSDGPVNATIKLRSDDSTPAVEGAWVIVAPPKFAPHQQNVITLYDRVLQAMVDGNLMTAPTTTSYTNDVHPILQRARDSGWVAETFGSHTWADPVTSDALRNAIFNKLKAPGGGGGNMPQILDSGTLDDRLTAVQYAHMQRWKDNNFTNDWTGVPAPQSAITPDGLDRAALEACVGGAFYPGIEAGGLPAARPIIVASNFSAPFRLNHGVVAPGAMTHEMALPWQNDFYQCGTNWWPVPRPNIVIRQGTAGQNWTGGVIGNGQDMVDKWHELGFVVKQGSQHVELDRCDLENINLLTPLLDFQDVPQGPMGMVREVALAITFEVSSTSPVTLEYAPGGAPSHPQLTAFNTSVTVGPTPASGVATARLWVIFRTSNPGDVLPPQSVTVRKAGGTSSWIVSILGNTVARKTAAAALVLDRSGSMSEDRGDGQSKHASLQQAASIFVDVMLEGDGAGVVRFNQDAQVLQNVLTLGSGGLSDINRGATKDIINGPGLAPSGQTSIGDGIFEGRGILNATATPFDVKALVVLSDGVENRSRMIADVAAEINEFTYAVGLGQPHNISVPALQTISGNNGGYLLVTGAIGTDNRFLLQKYFLQILAGISNAEIVLDPEGRLIPEQVDRIPFQLTDGDAGVDVILLTPFTSAVDFRVQAPSGQIIEPWRAMAEPGMRFVLSEGVSYYRLALPVQTQVANRFDGGGTWYALLTIGRPRLERSDTRDGVDHTIRHRAVAASAAAAALPAAVVARRASVLAAERSTPMAVARAAATHVATQPPLRTLPYSVVVHTYSNLSLHARLEQPSFEPGAEVRLQASLAQSGIPLTRRADVWAEVRRPDGSDLTITLVEDAAGNCAAQFATTLAGVYRVRIRARGTTMRGESFTREKTLTTAVWRGGDRPTDPHGGQVLVDYLRDRDARLCEAVACLTSGEGVIGPELQRRLQSQGFDIDRLRKWLATFCRKPQDTSGNRDD